MSTTEKCMHIYEHSHTIRIGNNDPKHVYYCSKCRHRVVSLTRLLLSPSKETKND